MLLRHVLREGDWERAVRRVADESSAELAIGILDYLL